ncbi:SURF1 family cytochrome oxidase biogenesis protein [Microbacterium oryzae]|uniref:SURF1 family cytochrome oxidase biogenesis protein n=1 Tax=Microbacterium oryzae TaxID=743009 RepID=UPI0025B06FDB|nr:SURF1 family cytochrome oxidase biogenesis protein [Microbacterium oryzae]MDN3311567.1 SURF1 family cytochrome oxidase biogenesis protein [Microbacterium oryzae]
MLRPRWIAMLVLCLVVAGVFSWLLQWQLVRAIDTDRPESGATEIVRPIDEVAQPGQYLDDSLVGQKVAVEGHWVPGDFIVVSSRYNDGAEGYWVTGQFRVDASPEARSIAVAIGWSDSRDEADAAAAQLEKRAEAADALPDGGVAGAVDLTGRLISDEGPQLPPGDDVFEMTRMSPAALLSRWHETEIDGEHIDVYRQYLTSDDPVAGLVETDLETIASHAPDEGSSVNWLNLFYAAEWAVFAGFSFYLWYRLAKDDWEREVEALAGVDPDEE